MLPPDRSTDPLAVRRAGFEQIVGNSKRMLEVFDRARRAAQADSTVLITGESGTGKELIAAAIHHNSPRHKGPFVAVNIAAVPETLVESELFGHSAGAFTGASANRLGRFAAAHEGTLFVDEVGDLEVTSQAKLLRVLENHRITPVGADVEQEVDVRVLAATSRDVEQMVDDGEFREDLYYRLNVVTIRLPALRDRPEDIPVLVQHFLNEFGAKARRAPLVADDELLRFLEAFAWPGNVRQLRNCIESMVVLADAEVLTLADLPPTISYDRKGSAARFVVPPGKTLSDLEKMAVVQTLERYRGDRRRAAQSLGISVRTLQRKLKS